MSDLRVGLVGAGHIAGAHLAGWRRARGARVVALLDRRREAAEARARDFRVPRVVDDLDALLEAVDVVDVCTPPAGHAEIAERVIEAGRHLLIEKPIVTAVAEWEQLRRLLETSPSEVAVVHNVKFTRAYRRMRRWLDAGRIGRLLRVERHFLTSPRHDRMLAPGSHWSHALPGGRWFETVPHDLYLVHDVAGPLAVERVLARRGSAAPAGAPADEVAVHLAGDGVYASIHYSANCDLNRRTVTLFGSRGTIRADLLGDAAVLSRRGDHALARAAGGLFLDAAGTTARWLPDRAGYAAARLAGRTPHARVIAAFVRRLRDGGPSPSPVEEIDFVVRNADAIGRGIEAALAGGGNGR